MKKTSFTKILVVLASIMMVAGTATAQWDGGSASNNDDGGNDQGSDDHTTYADSDDSDTSSSDSDSSSSTSSGWDGGSASNNDDGTGTSQDWDGGSASNDDDGSSSSSQWDGQSSQNDDDGSSSEWDGGDSTNNNDGEGEGTQWDGGDSTNNDNGDSTGSDDQDSEDNSDSEEDSSEDSEEAAYSDDGGTSDFEWSDINVLDQSLSFQLEPSSVEAGETVKVTGSVENAANADVEVMMDGSTVSQATTSSDGSFSTQFTADQVGEHTVTVKSEGKTTQKQLEVNPSLQVSNIHSTKLNSAGMTRVCADVNSQSTPTVTLMQSDISVETKEETGNVCFTTDLSEGTHTLAIKADAEGTTDSAETTVTVTGESTQISTSDARGNDTLLASVLQPFVQAFVQLTNMIMSIVP